MKYNIMYLCWRWSEWNDNQFQMLCALMID